jgi:hypothetical protein
MKRAFGILALIVVALGVWQSVYHDPYDPKNVRYLLWKHDLAPMNLDLASAIILIDPDRNVMILGRTPEELAFRFGYLKSSAEVRPHLRECSALRPGAKVMFLRNVDLMIVFVNGRASETVICKG